jgi:hypothetical protein
MSIYQLKVIKLRYIPLIYKKDINQHNLHFLQVHHCHLIPKGQLSL